MPEEAREQLRLSPVSLQHYNIILYLQKRRAPSFSLWTRLLCTTTANTTPLPSNRVPSYFCTRSCHGYQTRSAGPGAGRSIQGSGKPILRICPTAAVPSVQTVDEPRRRRIVRVSQTI